MKKRRFLTVLLSLAIVLASVSGFSIESDAASAKSILKKAYKQMKKYDTVFYYYQTEYKDNGKKVSGGFGCSISDTNISHSLSDTEEWHLKSRRYSRYSMDSSWILEKTEVDNKTPKNYYGKKFHQYCLKNLKNPKIKKTSKSYYIITGNDPTDCYKSFEYKINKKSNFVMEIICNCKDSTYTDGNGEEHSVTNQKWILHSICYGYGKLKAPKILK